MQSMKKKTLQLTPRSKAVKREHDGEAQNVKRTKSDNEHSLQIINFMKACEQVTQKANKDLCSRFQLLHLPICISNCKHIGSTTQVHQIVPHAEEIFMLEIRSNKWYEALEVSFLSVTETSYLSDNVLKNIVEIMMNAHEDQLSECHISHLIDKCQQVLSLNIRMHPPCSLISIRKCYQNFLTSPMDLKEKTLTDRTKFGSGSGIFKYCLNRLENELRSDSNDEPLFDKEKHIPQHMKGTIQAEHWAKSRLQIFEMLKRTDRIDGLMAVMDSLTELIGFDLAIIYSSQLKNEGAIRRRNLLINELLNVIDPITKKITKNKNYDTCVQIIKIFTYFVHLNYPEKYIKTMNFWINVLVQIEGSNGNCYEIHENKSNIIQYANAFYKIISELPPDSNLRVLEKLSSSHLRHYIGMLLCEVLLSVDLGDNVITILNNFIRKSYWNKFPKAEINRTTKIKKTHTRQLTSDNILKQLIKITENCNLSCDSNNGLYLKFNPVYDNFVKDQNFVTEVLYVTLQAYLDAYHVHKVHKTLRLLNNESKNKPWENVDNIKNHQSLKFITQDSVKVYRMIFDNLKDYFILIQVIKSKGELPKILDIFENIFDLREL